MKIFAILVLSLVLFACGFTLRQAPHFSFTTLYYPTSGSGLDQKLKRAIESGGQVRVLIAPEPRAQVTFQTLDVRREESAVSLTAQGQVRELVLRVRLKFKLQNAQGVELIPETELLIERNVSYSETAALSKEVEKTTLYNDMENDVVQQIMRRLAAVRL